MAKTKRPNPVKPVRVEAPPKPKMSQAEMEIYHNKKGNKA